MKKLLIAINLIATLSCIGIGVKLLLMPIFAESIFKEDYQTLMFKCDNVMRDHLIAKNRVIFEKSERSLQQLKAAEIGLISCHDYDRLRKRMKIWGISDNELSFIGLEAIEKNTKDIMKYVEIHEIKY
jgi:hypothetical protein